MLKRAAIILAFTGFALWIGNTSLFTTAKPSPHKMIAHRGVHQVDRGEGRNNDTCRAAQVAAFTHSYIENTLPSILAAFDAGAQVVEIDVHLTPDGTFAVFHDWRLECQTNGTGVTRETPIETLKALDIAHGFTSDGQTFPLRGTGIGLLPTLREVLNADLPGPVMINFKSRDAEEGSALARLLADPALRAKIWAVYGGGPPTQAALAALPGMRGYDRASVLAFVPRCMAFGWTGYVPPACRDTILPVPISHARWLWGWPHRFTKRVHRHGTDVILLGPWDGSGFTSGIDDPATLAQVPRGFDGYLWTNRIERYGLRPAQASDF